MTTSPELGSGHMYSESSSQSKWRNTGIGGDLVFAPPVTRSCKLIVASISIVSQHTTGSSLGALWSHRFHNSSQHHCRCNDSNSSETRLGKSLPLYFGEGLDEDSCVPEIEESLHHLEHHQLTSVEPTEKINIGTAEEPRTLRIETGLDPAQKSRMIDFLTEYQEQRADFLLCIKEEIVKQIDVGFLEVCDYSEWVTNIVPVEKKNEKVSVCINNRELNKASPKDNFSLSHIDVLVDNTARHMQFSFMDGFSGYNQIQMVEEEK
ncbi:hypothetical protein CRG98_039581, partial [Punica granatum]